MPGWSKDIPSVPKSDDIPPIGVPEGIVKSFMEARLLSMMKLVDVGADAEGKLWEDALAAGLDCFCCGSGS